MKPLPKIRFYAYRHFLVPTEQVTLSQLQVTDKNVIIVKLFDRLEHLNKIAKSWQDRRYILYFTSKLSENIYLCKFAKEKHFTKHREGDSDIESLKDLDYPFIYVIIDLKRQIILLQTPVRTLCLHETKPDIMYHLTGEHQRPLRVFVEDDLSKAIVKQVCERLQMSRYVSIQRYGAAKNAFTLVSGLLLQREDLSNSLFILDGDVFRSEEEKREQINAVLTGNTPHYQQLRQVALSKIDQLNLDAGSSPEKYVANLIRALNGFENNEVKRVALEIINVDNNHRYIDDIIERLGEDRANGLRRIVNVASNSPRWGEYTQPIEDWLTQKAPQVIAHEPQVEEIINQPVG